MSDLINREDAIEAWDKLSKRGRTEFDQVLMTLPSAKADWIPCSEGLPDVGERCLVTLSNDVVAIGTLHSDGEYEDDFGYIVKWGQRWHLEPASMMIAYPEDSVVAWAPRPKPYKGGDNK